MKYNNVEPQCIAALLFVAAFCCMKKNIRLCGATRFVFKIDFRCFKYTINILYILKPDFAWQTRYWEHIIRNEQAYYHISEYILNNPVKWAADKFYK